MKQISKFYITSFLKNQTYFTPILILFFQFHHLNFQEVFWVFSIGSITSFLIEIPTGIFADIYGKRKSIIISRFLVFVSYISFGFSSSFWMFVLSQVLFELGNSFRTGTETAYVFDYLSQNKGNASYTEVKGKQKFWARVGEAMATAIGGFIASIFGYEMVFFAASIPAFFNALITASWKPIDESKDTLTLKKGFTHAKDSVYTLFKKKGLLNVTLNIMIFSTTIAAVQTLIQPYMNDAFIPIAYFGIIYSVALGITAFAVRYSHILEKRFGSLKTTNVMTLLAVIPFTVIGLGHVSLVGVLLLFSIIFIENIRSPIVNNEFHKNVDSKKRATMGSILELSKSLGKIILLPIAGYVADAFSIYATMLLLGCIVGMNAFLFHLRKT